MSVRQRPAPNYVSDGERGPSWWDVARLAEQVRSEWPVAVEFALVPPMRRVDGNGYSSWTAVAKITRLSGYEGCTPAAQESYGSGGAWATAPAALHRALVRVYEALEAQKAVAVSQHVF